MNNPELLNEKKAAELLAVSVKTLQHWRFTRKGPCYVKLGRAVRYRLEDLQQFIESGHIRVGR